MILTDLYVVQELKQLKSHRYDCVASTKSYPTFEAIAAKAQTKNFYCYCAKVPDTFNADVKRKADLAITCTKNISSVFVPDITRPSLAYGDVKGTQDALLFIFNNDYKQIEIFVARGYRNCSRNLFNVFADGELDDEIEALRSRATAKPEAE